MSDFSGTAIVGFHVNPSAGSELAESWSPPDVTLGGVVVTVSNSGGSLLRVQCIVPLARRTPPSGGALRSRHSIN